MVAHVYPFTRNSCFPEVLRPAAVGPAVSRIALVLLFFIFPLLGAAGQTWQMQASLVELPGGVLVDPTLPAGVSFRGFTGLNLLSGDLARLSHPKGEMSAFYQIKPLDGGAERFIFRLSDGRTVEMVRVLAVPGRYHYLYRLDPDFFLSPEELQEDKPEADAGVIGPEPADDVPTRHPVENNVPVKNDGEASPAGQMPRILYVGTMTEGT